MHDGPRQGLSSSRGFDCPSGCGRLARRAKFRFTPTANHRLTADVLFRQEGRSRVVTNAGRDVVDARASARKSGRSEPHDWPRAGRTTFERTAKPCGPDAPTLAFKFRANVREAMVTTKPGHQGERGISRKTITQGMPGASAEPVCSCAHSTLHCARDRGCSAPPAFPAPSLPRANPGKTRACRAARTRSYVL